MPSGENSVRALFSPVVTDRTYPPETRIIMNKQKIFSVEEINRLLPKLSTDLEMLRSQKEELLLLQAHIDAAELIAEAKDPKQADDLKSQVDAYQRKVQSFYLKMESIESAGALIKDIDAGLIDFYSMRQDRLIFLCWKLGEESVQFWHEIEDGFAGRQPL